jgi:hypothetical protein
MGTPSPAARTVATNACLPEPLRIQEALRHLFLGKSIGYRVLPAVLLCGISVVWPGLLPYAVSGVACCLLIVASVYAVWYAIFLDALRGRGVLCPHCTSRIWQFCCGRCGEPVPPLAFMFGGLFLCCCPHCGLTLSCKKGTLHAWCSSCGGVPGAPPDVFYRKVTDAVVRVVSSLPDVPGQFGGWRVIAQLGNSRLLLYHPGDHLSASFMVLIVSPIDGGRLEPHLAERVGLVQIARAIPEAYRELYRARFPGVPFEVI